ncbi:hypothetical protein F4778DRAFT_776829 [Xylariomycetidae sp. FL2044]|nr:hypothetical protein F4778DRAFT_776829 [Xylariomycetidae sp. FL2044]
MAGPKQAHYRRQNERMVQKMNEKNQYPIWEPSSQSPRKGNPGDVLVLQDRHNAMSVRAVPRVFLRDACICEKCVDPSSGRKNFSTADIPERLFVESIATSEDGCLEVRWDDDFMENGSSHLSRYMPEQLIGFSLGPKIVQLRESPTICISPRHAWNQATISRDMAIVTYEDYVAGGEARKRALAGFHQHGLFMITQLPNAEHSLLEVAKMVGETRGGRIIEGDFSRPARASTDRVRLHTPHAAFATTPKLKFLHCLENTCQGGDYLFSDGLKVALQMGIQERGLYESLTPATGQKLLYTSRFLSSLSAYPCSEHIIYEKLGSSQIHGIHWDPASQDPVQTYNFLPDDKAQVVLAAIRSFQNKIEASENILRLRLEPGTCIVHDPVRVCSGRDEVVPTGSWRMNHVYMDAEYIGMAYNSFGTTLRTRQKKAEQIDEEWDYARKLLQDEKSTSDDKV